MKNGWTGGQYSTFRFLLGVYLFIHFTHLSFWGVEVFSNQGMLADGSASPLLHVFPNLFLLSDSGNFVTGVLLAAAALSILLAMGWWDRTAALFLWLVWASLLGRNPLIANPGLPYVGWLLLAHAALPSAPYGSWSARKRTDPDGGWRMTPSIYAVAWILLAVGYSYSGYTKLVSVSWVDGSALARVLENPLARPVFYRDWILALPPVLLQVATWGALGLELLFAPLALLRRVRPWLWLAMVGLHLGLIGLIDFADLTLGMLLIHLFTLDPHWIRGVTAPGSDILFYDGSCGLCHRAVRFALAEDRSGGTFRFAPLQSNAFAERVPAGQRETLPDSVVVLTAGGRMLTKSTAIVYLMSRLGGLWRLASWFLRILPRSVRDLGYDFVARVRHRLFQRPREACPIMPETYRDRWLPE